MSHFDIEHLNRLRRSRVVAAFSIENRAHAVPIAQALLAGGIDAIELTLRTPAAMDSLKAICFEVPRMLIGVGTILTPEMVAEVKAHGAHFGVAPGFNARVVRAAYEAGLSFAPGICTPSDLEAAIELGCRFVKFFPAEASGGLLYLRSVAAPYRHLGMGYLPLGGLTAQSMIGYLQEKDVFAVGGSWIVDKNDVLREDWAAITVRAAEARRFADSASN